MLDGADQKSLYQQNTDFELIEFLLPYLQNKTFLDIGAEKGSFTEFLSSHQLLGTFFEPLPAFASELNLIAEKTKCTFLTYAIDSKDGTAEFYSAYDHAGEPMDYFSSLHPLDHDPRITQKIAAKVTCRSLDSLLQEGQLNKQVGIVKIDTEGNDLNVLKGMKEIEAEIIMCEYFMPGIYAGWELGHPLGLIEEAKKLGFTHFVAIKRFDQFELISIDNPRFVDKQWGNLIFLKDSLFNMAKTNLYKLLAGKEIHFVNHILKQTLELRKACEEMNHENETVRKAYTEVNQENELLRKVCEERLALIVQLDDANKLLSNSNNKVKEIKKSWFKFINSR